MCYFNHAHVIVWPNSRFHKKFLLRSSPTNSSFVFHLQGEKFVEILAHSNCTSSLVCPAIHTGSLTFKGQIKTFQSPACRPSPNGIVEGWALIGAALPGERDLGDQITQSGRAPTQDLQHLQSPAVMISCTRERSKNQEKEPENYQQNYHS